MNSILQNRLFSGWQFPRFMGLALGVFFGIQALVYKEALAGFLSVFFLFQVITNTGCFGSSGCSVPQNNTSIEADEVEFTEIKKDS